MASGVLRGLLCSSSRAELTEREREWKPALPRVRDRALEGLP